MPTTMHELGLDRLSLDERLALADELYQSVVAEQGHGLLSEAHRADLQARLERFRDDPLAGSPWEEVKARLLASRP